MYFIRGTHCGKTGAVKNQNNKGILCNIDLNAGVV